jgi:hypothetical protein
VADFIRYRICSGVPLGVQILTPPWDWPYSWHWRQGIQLVSLCDAKG